MELQKILWSPGSYDSNLASSSSNSNENNNNNHKQQFKRVLPSTTLGSGGNNAKAKGKFEKSKLTQAIAFIHDYDIYYKPKIHSDLVIRVTTNGECLHLSHDKLKM